MPQGIDDFTIVLPELTEMAAGELKVYYGLDRLPFSRLIEGPGGCVCLGDGPAFDRITSESDFNHPRSSMTQVKGRVLVCSFSYE
jgi:hypothetical protein